MDAKFIISVIIFIILISLQFTLNQILKEIKEINNYLKRDSRDLK